MHKRAHNSIAPAEIWYLGQLFTGATSIYIYGNPTPVVSITTFTTRFRKLVIKNQLNDLNIAEALSLDEKSYRTKYGSRKTLLEIDGEVVCLQSFYEKNRNDAVVSYPNFRGRCIELNKRKILSMASAIHALTFEYLRWHSWYGGGRHRSFIYSGNAFPKCIGKEFRSITSFLDEIGRSDDKSLIWTRLKAGWNIDDAIIIPANNENKRTGSIYMITRIGTRQIYIGLTKSTVQQRWAFHIWHAMRGGKSKLAQAIREDGVEGFNVVTIEEGIPSDLLANRERYWVSYYNALGENGLNKAPAGGLGSPRGHSVVVNGEKFISKKEAAEVISRRTGIAEYVILSRIKNKLPIPDVADVRVHSKHPEAGSNLFRRWLGLRKRHPNSVIESWCHSYDAFKTDVSPIPEKMELVRINNQLPWGPSNTEWVSIQEKIERSHGKPLTVNGHHFPTLTSAAKALGISIGKLKKKISTDNTC